MKRITVGLLDETGYMKKLDDYLYSNDANIMETHYFSSVSSVNRYFESEKLDLLITESVGILSDITDISKSLNIIYLSDGNDVGEGEMYSQIYKYQAAENIVSQIIDALAVDERIPELGKDKCLSNDLSIYCYYSPGGNPFQSYYAVKDGERLSADEKVLYIEMDFFSNLCSNNKNEKTKDKMQYLEKHKGISELIFFVRQKKKNLSLKISSMIFKIGRLDCICEACDIRDLYEIQKEDMEELFRIIKTQTQYEKVIVNLGFINNTSFYIFEASEKIIMPTPDNDYLANKQSLFENYMEKQIDETIKAKIEYRSMEMSGVGG